MNKFHPFYVIGTGGMIISALLHLFLSLGLSIAAHSTFFVLYPLFLTFLLIGVALTIKEQALKKKGS